MHGSLVISCGHVSELCHMAGEITTALKGLPYKDQGVVSVRVDLFTLQVSEGTFPGVYPDMNTLSGWRGILYPKQCDSYP